MNIVPSTANRQISFRFNACKGCGALLVDTGKRICPEGTIVCVAVLIPFRQAIWGRH